MDRPNIIRMAITDHGGYLNGQKVPAMREVSTTFLRDRFTEMGVI